MFKRDADLRATTIIGKGAELNGGFSSPGSVRIDGVVRGDTVITGSLILGPEGRIFGDVVANSMVIGGQVKGDLTARDKVKILAGAVVKGDITTSRILIDEQAVFQGRCSTGPREEEEDGGGLDAVKDMLLAEKEGHQPGTA